MLTWGCYLSLYVSHTVHSDDVAEEVCNLSASTPPPPTDLRAFGGMSLHEACPPDLLDGSTSSSASSSPTTSMDGKATSSSGSSMSPRFKYLLQSVIVHHGSANGGHYTVFRRLSSVQAEHVTTLLEQGGKGVLAEDINTWVHISDDAVLPVKLEEVLECEAYMLFYQSLESLQNEGQGR